MSNTVTHKTAIALKDAGWEKETERVYNPYKQLCLKGYALLHYEKSHIIAAPTFSEIWEGDVVESGLGQKLKVKYRSGTYLFQSIKKHWVKIYAGQKGIGKKMTVIGNIHENPEL